MDPKMEHIFYAFVGGMLNLRDHLESQREELKEAHAHNAETAKAFVDDLSQRGAAEKDELRASLTKMLKEVVDELGLATKEDLAALRKDLGLK